MFNQRMISNMNRHDSLPGILWNKNRYSVNKWDRRNRYRIIRQINSNINTIVTEPMCEIESGRSITAFPFLAKGITMKTLCPLSVWDFQVPGQSNPAGLPHEPARLSCLLSLAGILVYYDRVSKRKGSSIFDLPLGIIQSEDVPEEHLSMALKTTLITFVTAMFHSLLSC